MKKPPRQRAKKGSVSLKQRGDYLQLRWSVDGHPFSLSAGLNNPLNNFNARELAAQIERDISLKLFDPTLDKYKPKLIAHEQQVKPESTVELFSHYTQSRRDDGTSEQTISAKYKAISNHLKRFGQDITTEADALEFVNLLKSFGDWATQQQAITFNPFAHIKPLKTTKTTSPTRKPFSRDEIKRLLEAAKTHRTLYKMHDFCMTILYLGLRPSEAIGLRWQDVDLVRGEVTIEQSLARNGQGQSGGSSRVRKPTKTGTIRTLGLPNSLLTMLRGRAAANHAPKDLIFLSPQGCPIDDHNFSQKTWKKLCTLAGVPHRVPYACRHTVLSYGIETGGLSLKQAQYVAGHSTPRMVMETYGHMKDKPILTDWQED
jgi:integrase